MYATPCHHRDDEKLIRRRTNQEAGVALRWVVWTPVPALLEARGEAEALRILPERTLN